MRQSHAPRLFIDVVVRDKDGIVLAHNKQEGHSFVRQWIEGHSFSLRNISFDVTLIGGGSGAVGTSCHIASAVGQSGYGVVCGTGDTAVTINDYTLESQIIHGAGAGQLSHSIVTQIFVGVNGSNIETTHARTFTNNSGSEITVKEVGLYLRVRGVGTVWMGARDILASPAAVPNSGTLTVTYTVTHPV